MSLSHCLVIKHGFNIIYSDKVNIDYEAWATARDAVSPTSNTLSSGKESIGPLHDFMQRRPLKGFKRTTVGSREGLIVEDTHG